MPSLLTCSRGALIPMLCLEESNGIVAMPWYVKSKKADGSVNEILIDDPSKVLEILEDQRARWRNPWIEDFQGKPVDESLFKTPRGESR